MTQLSRRHLLGSGLALGGLVAFPRFLRADPAPGGRARKTLVLLHLVGGNDGLNTVVPATQRAYERLRPTLALDPRTLVPLSDGLSLHPALAPLGAAWKAGQLAIVNGVGYPQPDYSHFRATEIWHTAQPDRTPHLGWVGRALDARAGVSPLSAVALAREQPLALTAGTPCVATLTDFARFRLPAGLERAASLYAAGGAGGARRGATAAVAEAGERALALARRIAQLSPAAGPFDGALGDDLRKALALLGADLKLDALHLSLGGFDTHAAQARTHAELLGTLARNLATWQTRLTESGLADRVVTLVYSEFGRRAGENASAGTDHGAAGPVLLLGHGVRGGLHGAYPSLDRLDDGNLVYTTDFRRLYAALLAGALDLDPEPIVGRFAPLEVLS